MSIAIVDNGSNDASLFLSKALAIGTTPTFQIDSTSASRATPTTFDKRTVVVLNDTMFPPAGAGGVLRKFVERGGGLLIVAGEHTTWPGGEAELFPGKLGRAGEPDVRAQRLARISRLQPSRCSKCSRRRGPEIFPRRTCSSTAPSNRRPADRVLARYDDGAVAAVERKVGAGRVIVWTSTLDDTWTDIAVKPIFLPLVQQLARYLAHYEQPQSWFTVGQVLDLNARGRNRPDRVVVTPSGQRLSSECPEKGCRPIPACWN